MQRMHSGVVIGKVLDLGVAFEYWIKGPDLDSWFNCVALYETHGLLAPQFP